MYLMTLSFLAVTVSSQFTSKHVVVICILARHCSRLYSVETLFLLAIYSGRLML